jgi:hypothetical protein
MALGEPTSARVRTGRVSDRIEALGGTLQVTSLAGSGTTLLIEVPLEGQRSAVSPEPYRRFHLPPCNAARRS